MLEGKLRTQQRMKAVAEWQAEFYKNTPTDTMSRQTKRHIRRLVEKEHRKTKTANLSRRTSNLNRKQRRAKIKQFGLKQA